MQDLNDKITGNTLTAAEWNEVPSEIQNVIEALGITLSSGDLNQLGKAIAGYVANGIFYTDSGIADAYVLIKIGLKQTATAYADGFFASFIAGNPGTGGAATVNVAGLGVKNIKLSGGGDPLAGSISGRVNLVFDGPNDRFELLGVEIDRLNPETLAIWQDDTSAQLKDAVTTAERATGTGGGATGDVIASGTANGIDIVAHGSLPLSWALRDPGQKGVDAFGGLEGAVDNTAILQRILDLTGVINTHGKTFEFATQLLPTIAKGFRCNNIGGGLKYTGPNTQAIVAEKIDGLVLRNTKCTWNNDGTNAQSFLSLNGCTNPDVVKNNFNGPESVAAYFAVRVIEDNAGVGTIGSSVGNISYNIFNVGQSAILYQGGSAVEQNKHFANYNIVTNNAAGVTLAEMIKVDLNTNLVDVSHNIIDAGQASSCITVEEKCRNVVCAFNQNTSGIWGYRLIGGQAQIAIDGVQVYGGYCHGQTGASIILGSWDPLAKLSIESIDLQSTGDGIDGASLALGDEIKIKDVDIDCTGTGMSLRNAKLNVCGNTVKNAALGYFFRNAQLGSKANDNRSEEVSGRDFQLQDCKGLQMNDAYAIAVASKADSVAFLGVNTRCSIWNGVFHINATTGVMNTLSGGATNNCRIQGNDHHGSGAFVLGSDPSNTVGDNVDFP